MSKKIMFAVSFLVAGFFSFAQQHDPGRMNTYSDEAPTYGFTKENMFVGGSLSLGYMMDGILTPALLPKLVTHWQDGSMPEYY